MKKVRLLLNVEGGSPYYHMGLDEALLELKSMGRTVDTMRLYVFKPSSITIGYFQKIREVVRLDVANSLGIPVVRRVTGGGAVYHDMLGEVTYSTILSVEERMRDVQKSYEIICGGIVEALKLLGVKCEFHPINDVIVGGKKISGSAQARRGNALLQHGTLMYNTDLEMIEKLLNPPREKLEAKGISSIRHRVINLREALGEDVSLDDVVEALVKGFEKALNIKLVEGDLREEEERLAIELSEKYKSRNWNFKR